MNIAFHYYAVKALALSTGFGEKASQRIAEYSQFTDDFIITGIGQKHIFWMRNGKKISMTPTKYRIGSSRKTIPPLMNSQRLSAVRIIYGIG